jgi:hypothetical protein
MESNCDYLYSDSNLGKLADILVKQWGDRVIQKTDDAFGRSYCINKLLHLVGERVMMLEVTECVKELV